MEKARGVPPLTSHKTVGTEIDIWTGYEPLNSYGSYYAVEMILNHFVYHAPVINRPGYECVICHSHLTALTLFP